MTKEPKWLKESSPEQRLFMPADDVIRLEGRVRDWKLGSSSALEDSDARRRRVYGGYVRQDPRANTPCAVAYCRTWKRGRWAMWTHLEAKHAIKTRAQLDRRNTSAARAIMQSARTRELLAALVESTEKAIEEEARKAGWPDRQAAS
jgi:hypothetical protein